MKGRDGPGLLSTLAVAWPYDDHQPRGQRSARLRLLRTEAAALGGADLVWRVVRDVLPRQSQRRSLVRAAEDCVEFD